MPPMEHEQAMESTPASLKGGPRRTKTPDVDHEHLLDCLANHVRKQGQQAAFQLHQYDTVQSSQAIRGASLAQSSASAQALIF